MAEQMIQKKQLRSTTCFGEEVDTEKTDGTCKSNDVTKKNSKVEVQGTKTKKHGSSVGSTVSTTSTRSSGTKKPVKVVDDVHNSGNTQNDNQIMCILNTILENQKKQDEQIGTLNNKINMIENEFQECDDYEGYDDDQTYDESCNNVQRTDDNVENSDNASGKRKSDHLDTEVVQESSSRFKNMSKRFKSREVCDVKIDETLATNITDLFRNGMNEDQYSDMIKDENNARPENCEGLKIVKTNQLVWDIISQEAKTIDRKMQNIETSVIKGSIILAKVVNKLADVENELDDTQKTKLGKIIDECNDSLALFGHANKQVNMTRRELIKPELRYEYLHLCAQTVPYTSWLFGDDISKTAKEIEDCSKIGHKLNRGGSFRGRMRGRFRGRRPRGRGNYYNNNSAYNPNYSNRSSGQLYPKNFKKSNTTLPQQKNKTQ